MKVDTSNSVSGAGKTKRKQSFSTISPLIVSDIILFAVFGWANWVNFTDESGWSGLFTIPVLLLVFAALIIIAGGFVVLAFKAPKKTLYRAYMFLGAAFSLLPITCTVWYALISNTLEQTAKQRAETPISLQQARQLVETCQVETIYRHDGGRLQLTHKVPVLPGEDSRPEYRSFDVKYYDELFALVRDKQVQDRCGFIPSYDIERSKKPAVNRWISKDEAAAIIEECFHSTQLYTDARYYPNLELPESSSKGILLSERLNVWNDEKDSTIYLIGVEGQVASFLQAKDRDCFINKQ